jgi:hypothetical protein
VKPAPVFYWSVNVGITALSAWLQGRGARTSVPRAVLAGAVGGSLMYAGQRVVGSAQPALRLLGVQTVALGANVARNTAQGVPALSDLTFPVFPFYVRVRPHADPAITVRVSTVALVSGIRMGTRYRRWPELGESLVSGGLVFRVPGSDLHCYLEDGSCLVGRVGEHVFGAVAFAESPDPCSTGLVVAHELGHIAQDARDAVLHAIPASDTVLSRAGAVGRWLSRYLVVDGFLPLMAASWTVGSPPFDAACHPSSSYYECEAEAMLWRHNCGLVPASGQAGSCWGPQIDDGTAAHGLRSGIRELQIRDLPTTRLGPRFVP